MHRTDPPLLRATLLIAAVTSSLATSSTYDGGDTSGGGQVALHNASDQVLEVEVDLTLTDEPVDCELMEAMPELLSHVPLDATGWTGGLQPSAVALVDPDQSLIHACRVARVTIDGLGSRMLFWRTDGIWGYYPTTAEDPTTIGSPVVSVLPGIPEPFRDGHDTLVFPDDPGQVPTCDADVPPFGWSGPESGSFRVVKHTEGGACPGLRLEGAQGVERVLEVCVPPRMLAFADGARLDVVSDGDNLRITDRDEGIELRVALGDPSPFGFDLEVDPLAGCLTGPETDPGLRPLVSGPDGAELPVGTPMFVGTDDEDVWLAVRPAVLPLVPRFEAPPRFGAALLTRR